MKKGLLSIVLILLSFACFSQGTLVGPSSGCIGSSSYFADSGSSVMGTWSSSDISIAVIDSFSGIVYGVSVGVATITFTPSVGSYLTTTFTVDAGPLPISETLTNFCAGATSICTDASPGGSWSVDADYAIISSTGAVTGMGNGVVNVYYTVGGCSAVITDTVNAPSPGALAAPPVTCVGAVTSIEDSLYGASGGTWTVSNSAIATVDGGGLVTGISPGTDTVTYTIAGSCGTASTSTVITISAATYAGTLPTGTITVGATAIISDSGASAEGIWSSSNPTIASIDSTSGVITGIMTGTTTITYSVNGCGGILTASAIETVSLLDGISGHIFFDSSLFYGDVKVWLISYNPATLNLEAVDSAFLSLYGVSEAYYQFTGLSTDSFRVKAAVVGDSGYVSYVPTYHTSSFYWDSANVLYHIAGTGDVDQDIHLAFGFVSPGPGFVGGNVTTGANKGTSTSVPVIGLLVFAIDATTNTLVQHTYTDSGGNFSFSNLPLGNYFVYPEDINYRTVPFIGISLTSSIPSMNSAFFTQHTLSHTITPYYEQISSLPVTNNVGVFPNPVNKNVNVEWRCGGGADGVICITDITGRSMFNSSVDMNQGNGNLILDLSGFNDGIYLVTLKSSGINYTSKILVQH